MCVKYIGIYIKMNPCITVQTTYSACTYHPGIQEWQGCPHKLLWDPTSPVQLGGLTAIDDHRLTALPKTHLDPENGTQKGKKHLAFSSTNRG